MADYSLPPPPYTSHNAPTSTFDRFSPKPKGRASISILPLHVIHRIFSLTLDPYATPSKYAADIEEETVRRLWAMFRALRGVDRRFYLVATSILRTHFLPIYTSLLIPPISSDPYPFDSAQISSPSHHLTNILPIFKNRSRETAIFDRFIAIRVGEDLRKMESELCENSEGEREIFTRLQPQARHEDLLLDLPSTLISPLSISSINGSSTVTGITFPLPHEKLSINLTPVWVQLYYVNGASGKGGGMSRRLIIEVKRQPTAEATVRRIQEGLEDLRRGLVGLGEKIY